MSVVRFAPSPTGNLHIGGARTCLFNWLYARSTQGKFILRIEDTDQKRSEQRYVDEILNSIAWLGLSWDELQYQSKRFDIYRQYADKLLAEGKAHKEGDAVILKVPENIRIRFFDLVHEEISVDAEQLKDQVLMKSDGSPTYNFCCGVDDALMGITHVIRGDDHIANTPKQIILYEALGLKPPKFVHIPMILGEDRSRMSKRHGATAISEYRAQGYLPEALVNYLALLGWSPGNDRELFSLATLVKDFSLKRLNKTAAVFDINKLNWINGQYLKNMDAEMLMEMMIPYLKEQEYLIEPIDREWLKGLIQLYKTRFQTLPQFISLAKFFFTESIAYEQDAVEKHLSSAVAADYLERFRNMLEQVEPFTVAAVEQGTRAMVEELAVKGGDVIHPVRVALTGGTVSPGIFEVIQFLGKDKAVRRLKTVTQKIRSRTQLFDKLDEL